MDFKRPGCRSAALLLLSAMLAAHARAAEALVRASSVHSTPYAAHYAVDGDPDTRWAGAATGDPQWLEIDFGQEMGVADLAIHWERAHALEYEIQVSSDRKTWRTLHHEENGRGGRVEHRNLGGKGRYLRILCLKHGSWKLSSIWELEPLTRDKSQGLFGIKARETKAREKAAAEARRALLETLPNLGVDEIVFALRQPGRDGHWYANFGYYAFDDKRLTYGDGGKLCRLNLKTGKRTVLLEDPKGGVRDPIVHYDAKKILFSYRKGGTPTYHLYEVGVDGSNLRQLTDGAYNDIEPTYLPDGDILFVSSRCKRWVNCWVTPVAVLYRCDGDGGNIRPISSNNEHDNTPWLLPTGQVVYTRWEYVDRSQVDYHHLWIANPDGTAQTVYYGNMKPGLLLIDAKPIPGTNKTVVVFSPGHGRREHAGRLGIIDPRGGPDAEPFARTFTRSDYRDPWAFSEDLFMAAKDARIVLLNAQGHEHELYRCTTDEARAGLQCHEPRPLMPRPRERVIPDRIKPDEDTGQLMLVDIYRGRNMAGVERGEIKKLLVLETLPKPINFTGGMDPLSYGGTFTLERVLGTVPVEEDGSAYMEVPALRSLFFVALDENDLSVKRMHSFLTVQPGEVTSCVGCHENRIEAPSNPPVGAPLALRRPPSRIEPIGDCPEVFDFPRDIQPILDKLCVDCHGYEKTKRGGPYAGGVVLTGDRGPMFSHAYFTMTVKQLFIDNRNRPVGNLPPRTVGSSASRILTEKTNGSHHGVKATPHQRKMLRLWIDVGAPYPGTYAALGCGAIGGYWQNGLMNRDDKWPTTRAGSAVIQRRCAGCHTRHKVLPKSMSDERGVSFWRFNIKDPRLPLSRHIVFNLTRPEKSLMLLAPLAKDAGGFELCRDKAKKPAIVFANTEDADYAALLAMVRAGKENLDSIKRFDMPGFQPPPQYVREMKRYGILPADLAAGARVDPYDTDRCYWRSLWK